MPEMMFGSLNMQVVYTHQGCVFSISVQRTETFHVFADVEDIEIAHRNDIIVSDPPPAANAQYRSRPFTTT